MHAAAISPRGGVARRAASLRGQGIIEYVLLIAVISLTVAFAGPPVAGAIGKKFTAIAGAVGGSITGGAIGGIGGGTSSGGTTMKPGSGSTGSNKGTADDGAEALTDILFSEAVVSLGHALPFCLPYDQG